jgi:hypothetical protein
MAPVALLMILFLAAPALADTLYLKDGTKITGQVLEDAGGIVRVRTAGGVQEIPRDQVERIEKPKSPIEDYKERRATIADSDVPALLELARWCGEVKLPAYKRKTMNEILKACPEHPEAHRDLNQAHVKGKWVEVKAPPPAPNMEPGEKTTVPESPVTLVPAKGWEVSKEAGRLTAKGPARYATPPVLTIGHGPPSDPPLAFEEKEGWEKPAEAKAGPATGSRSRRSFVEGDIDRTEWVAVFPYHGREVVLRLVCLAMEAEVFAPAFEQALASLELAMPKAEYVNLTYKYQLDRPKPDSDWEWAETDGHDLVMQRNANEPMEIALLTILSGNPGKEYDEMVEMTNGLMDGFASAGQVLQDAEITLAGEKARLLEGTTLMDGIPVLMRFIRVEHRGRLHLLQFTRHEHGKPADAAWEKVLHSFAFTD